MAPFYRTPSLEAARGWREQTPEGFLVRLESLEVHHPLWKLGSLEKCDNSIELMETRLKALSPKQLARCCFMLAAAIRQEPRAAGLISQNAAALLSLCFRIPPSELVRGRHPRSLRDLTTYRRCSITYDAPSPWEVTARHVYVRGHGAGRSLQGPLPRIKRCAPGRADMLPNGSASAARCSSISTTIRKVPRPRTQKRLMELVGGGVRSDMLPSRASPARSQHG